MCLALREWIISLDHVTEVLQRLYNRKQRTRLAGVLGRMLIYHPNAELVQQNIADVNVSDNVVNAIVNQSTEFLKYKADGTTKYGSVQLVGETGYLVVSNMPFLEYYQMLFATIGVLLAIFAVGIIVVMRSIDKSAYALSKPIAELNETASRLAEGDLDVELNVMAKNEIGELAESIRATVARLKEYIAYLKRRQSRRTGFKLQMENLSSPGAGVCWRIWSIKGSTSAHLKFDERCYEKYQRKFPDGDFECR